MVREDKAWVPLDDRIWGIEGTYYNDRKVKGFDAEEDAYIIQYIPESDPNKSILDWLKSLIGRYNIKETPEPVPQSQFGIETVPRAGGVDGAPREKMVLHATVRGDAYWDDQIGRGRERDVQKHAEKAKEREGQAVVSKAEKLAAEHEKTLEEDTGPQYPPELTWGEEEEDEDE